MYKLTKKEQARRRENLLKWNYNKKGKTYEQIYGLEKAKKLKEVLSKLTSGKNNPFYGKIPYNKGKKGLYSTSEETKEILRTYRKNQINSPENSSEIREKMSKALKGKSYEQLFGKEKADKLKDLRRKAALEAIRNNSRKGFGFPKDGTMKERRKLQKFPMEDTKIEKKLQTFLGKLHIWNLPHFYIDKIEHSYPTDIYIPKYNLVIEADGNFWHGNPNRYSWKDLSNYQKEQRVEDAIRTAELKLNGFNVMRLWEDEIENLNINDFKNKLMETQIK